MADPVDAAQNFFNAHAAAQLAILPQFSNKIADDKFTAAQWLAKVLNHKQGADWTDAQTITHVRNALRGPLLDWYDSLGDLGVNTAVWAEIQARFETDFEAAPSASSVVYKITEIKQTENEDVNEYFGRCLKTMKDFKSKVDPARFVLPPATLTQNQADAYEEVPQATRAIVETHVRNTAVAMALDNVSAILLTAGLKSELRTEILKHNYITLREIKDAALKAERLRKEKPFKPSTNGSNITEINEDEEVNAMYRGNRANSRGNYRGNQQNSRGRGGYSQTPAQTTQTTRGGTPYQGPNRGTQQVQGRGTFRGNNYRGAQNNRGGQNTSESDRDKCRYCKKPGHMIADCWRLQNKKPEGTSAVNDNECQEEEQDQDGSEISGIYNVDHKFKTTSKNQ